MTVGYSQEGYWGALADPVALRQYLSDWAAGGGATHGVAGANNQGQSSYEQVLADLQSRGIDLTGVAQHVTAAPAQQGIGQLDPAYEAYYQNALRGLNTGRDEQLAQNDYSRSLAATTGTRQLGQLAQQWDTTRGQLPGSYIQRGVFDASGKSGIYNQGLQNYAQDRGAAQSTATDAYNQSLRSYDLNADKIRQDTQNRTLDLDSQRQARYQGAASGLANAKPFTV